MTVSIEDQIREVAREIALRRNVYKGWVAKGKMTQAAAYKQIGAMEAVIETLKLVQAAHQHAAADHRETFFIASDGEGAHFRDWTPLGPSWTSDKLKAVRFCRREDAEAVFGEDDEVWKILEVSA